MNFDDGTLAQLLARLAAGAASIVFIALLASALALLAIRWLDLQARAYRAGLRRFLTGIRATIFLNRGLAPSKRLLFQMTDDEAHQILHAGAADQKGSPVAEMNLERRLRTAVEHPDVLADFRGDERKRVEAGLIDQAGAIEIRWHRWLNFTCAIFALPLAALLQYSAFEIVASMSHPIPLPVSVWGGGIGYFTSDPDRVSHLIGVLLTALLSTLLAGRFLQRRFATRALDDHPVAPDIPTLPMSADPPPIGEAGRPIRAINFSSGGFDTLMHLGVIHSLVVIQGRAPDVVVGLSAGAIHAAALPEILQAGDDAEKDFFEQHKNVPWQKLQPAEKHKLQRLRVLARVERLRHYIESAQLAPGRLLDAILPDAYQIDATKPLQPLQQPRLSQQERTERGQFVTTRSGLARLYNDVLNVPLRISTLTKITRRVLGLVASGDITSMPRRVAVRMIEMMRLWILVGANLLSVAKIARIVDWALLAIWRRKVRDTTAAGLIFAFRSGRWVRRTLVVTFLLMLTSAVWLVMSFTVVPLFSVIAVAALFAYVVSGDTVAKLHAMDGLQGLLQLFFMVFVSAVPMGLSIVFYQGAHTPDDVFHNFWELPWMKAWFWCFAFSMTLIGIVQTMRLPRFSNPRSVADRFLEAYGLDDAIFREHGLRSFLAEIFDPNYYARASMNRAVEAALDGKSSITPLHSEVRKPRTLADFYDPKRLPRERIHVGIAVANTENGALEVVRPDVAIVEALVAATAVTPWLPPVEMLREDSQGHVRKVLYVDGGNVSREPTHALLKLMRERRRKHKDVGELHIYSVSPFPMSTNETGTALSSEEEFVEEQGGAPESHPGRQFHQYLGLVDIVWRAMRLQRFRDAGLERKLTNLFTDALPSGENVICVQRHSQEDAGSDKHDDQFFRARVKPIELEYDSDLNRRLYRGVKGDRRRIIAESIADGCRAAMQVMIVRSIDETGKRVVDRDGSEHTVALCSDAVAAHLKKCGLSIDSVEGRVPGSNPLLGPGLSEICEHCTLRRPLVGSHVTKTSDDCSQRLRIARPANVDEDWPHERIEEETAPKEARKPPDTPERTEMNTAWGQFAGDQKKLEAAGTEAWPEVRNHFKEKELQEERGKTTKRPLISLLFSGGVFRGVYQVGVLNALNELGLKPDIIAGASIGSVTAAMVAEAFSIEHEADKKARIARLAATYLAVDRLILTDRLADFVRSFTLRASQTRFSIQEADRVFRRYDQQTLRQFDRSLRRVVAGMERLLYLSPYHLNEIVRAFRDTDSQRLTALLNEAVQRFLDRMGVGDEALGAEALRDLITNYVIGNDREHVHPVGLTIDELRNRSQILFLATATNLTRGRLEVLGSLPIYENGKAPVLEEALLASSAFPGVFRPRWTWEVIPGAEQVNQFIDGGVMDNLPIDAIAATLHRAAMAEMIERVPAKAPHLVVGASLEVRAPSYALAFTRDRFRNSWIMRRRRTRQLGYNTKLDTYERAEKSLRAIQQLVRANYPDSAETDLVDIQLVSIKPERLCGTFGFHPMLGFRRTEQAMSIAHGCATTLLEFARRKADTADSQFAQYLPAWNIAEDRLPKVINWEQAFAKADNAPPLSEGKCWIRGNVPCPFSRTELSKRDDALEKEQPLGPTLIREISKIHECCSKRETHLRRV